MPAIVIAVTMLPAYVVFLLDLRWVRPDRIRRSGIPATSWERTSQRAWEVTAAAMLILLLSPAILMFYAHLRPRLLEMVVAGSSGDATLRASSGRSQSFAFARYVVGWWILLALVVSTALLSEPLF
jgi:hypothetical protein